MFDKKVRYKMYKAGKNWMVAGITTVAAIMGMAAVSNGNDVHADQIQTQPATKESKDQAHAAIQGQQVKLQSSAKSTDSASAASQDKAQAASSSAASSSSQASQESSANKNQTPAKSQAQTQSSQAAASSTSTKADQANAASQSSTASTSSTKADTAAKTDAASQAGSTKTDAASQAQSSSQQQSQAQKKSQTQKAFRTLAAQPDSASDQTTTTVNDDRANADAKFTVHYKDHKGNTISDDTVLDFKFHRDYEVDAQNNPVKVGDWTFQSVSQSGTEFYGLENPTLTDSTDQADIYGATLYAPNINHYDRDDDYRRPYTISLSKAAAAPSGLNQEFTMTYQGEAETYDVAYRVAQDYRKPWNESNYGINVTGDEIVKVSGHYGDKIPFDYQAHLPEGFELVPGQNLSPELTMNEYYNMVTVWVQPVEHTSVNITLHDNTTGKDITYNNVSINRVDELKNLAKNALIATSAKHGENDFTITSDPIASVTALPANNTSYTVDFNENIITQDHVEPLMIPDAIQVDEGWLPKLTKLLSPYSTMLSDGLSKMDDLQMVLHDSYRDLISMENSNLSDEEVDKEATAKANAMMKHIHYYSGTLVTGGSGPRFAYGDYAFGIDRASGKAIDLAFEVKYNCFTGQALSIKFDPSKFTLPELKVPAGYKAQVIGVNDPFSISDVGFKIYDSDSDVIQQGISNILDYLNEYYFDINSGTDSKLGLAVDSDGNLTSSDSNLLSAIAEDAYMDHGFNNKYFHRILYNRFSYGLPEKDFWKYVQIMLSPLLLSVYQKNFQFQQNSSINMYNLGETFFSLVPEDQHVTVQYKDGDKVVNSQVFNGKTDQTINLTFDKVPANYDVDGNLPSSSYKFTADGNQVIVINLKHQTETKPDSRTITRTITIKNPDGTTTDKSQKLDFNRTATFDKVTKTTTHSDWIPVNDSSFAEVDVPDIPGYTPSQKSVDAHTLTQDDINNWTDPNVNIVYTANKQTVRVRYMDGNKEVAHEDFNGHTDETTNLTFDKVPANYDVDGKLPNTSYTFTADGNQIITINLKHQTETKPDSKTITRTITIKNPDGTTTDKSQKLDFKRTATIDKVTGKAIAYSDWTPKDSNSFAEVDVPDIPGYTPSQKNVEARTLTQDDINNWKDTPTNITYTANDQHVTVQYKDGDKVVASQTFNGHTGETTDLTFDKVPANYDVNGKLPNTSYTFTADGDQVVTISLKHQMENVPDAKTVTRTISVTTPDGKTTTTVQKADLTRTNVRDKVTGNVTDGTWSKGHFDEFTVPAVAGYAPSQTSVAAQDVDGTTQNGTVNITYTANKQTGKISYVDQKTNEEIKSEPLNGVTDGNVAVKVDVPAGYHVVSGQNIPTSVKATADGVPTVTVYVAKDETPSKPTNPTKPVTPEKPVNPSKPTTPEKPVTPAKPSQPAEKPSTPAQKPAKKTSSKKNAGNSQADANRLKMLEKERKARLAALAAKAAEQADAEARAKARARAARAEAARKAMEAAQAKRNAAAAQAASESRSNSLNNAQGVKAQAASETETAAQTVNAQNAKAKSQKSGKLPQTGDQNNGEGAVVLGTLAGILGLFGLGADRKRRRN